MKFKGQREPKMTTQALLSLDLDDCSSSDDSDFRVEDHKEDYDFSDVSKDGDESSDSSEEGDTEDEQSDDSTQQLQRLLANDGTAPQTSMLHPIDNRKEQNMAKFPIKPVCCICLGDRGDDSNEIVKCDNCGVSVHEGCYGVSDNSSMSSTNSTCSTEPWFCEACRAGVANPNCELCPNEGGIFKETDVNRWVHLVCALYIPGIAFGEVDQLSSVTLFEMQYSKWGTKACSLCENSTLACTGVCIGCDAGMCKTYFHVTCAQAAGLLTEAYLEEADAVDPFYAHCKMHSENDVMKKRKRNYQILCMNMQQKIKDRKQLHLENPCPAQMRIQRKLLKHQSKYITQKQMKGSTWVPTQKMPRMLNTSASAHKRIATKVCTTFVDLKSVELKMSQIEVLQDIRKKWHIPVAFNVEFVAYYVDRVSRTQELKSQLSEMVRSNTKSNDELISNCKEYDSQLETVEASKEKYESLLYQINQMHKQIKYMVPNKILSNPTNIGQKQPIVMEQMAKTSTPPTRPISVPTAAALKMGVGFPLSHLCAPGTKVDSTCLLSTQAKGTTVNQQGAVTAIGSKQIIPSNTSVNPSATAPELTPTLEVQNYECDICKSRNDQHLLTKCDTCKLYYHLGCLNPPLIRPPKKFKLYDWQCSECDKSEESDAINDIPKRPRKSRKSFNKDGSIMASSVSDNDNNETKNHPVNAAQITRQTSKRRSADSLATAKLQTSTTPVTNTSPKKNLNKQTTIPAVAVTVVVASPIIDLTDEICDDNVKPFPPLDLSIDQKNQNLNVSPTISGTKRTKSELMEKSSTSSKSLTLSTMAKKLKISKTSASIVENFIPTTSQQNQSMENIPINKENANKENATKQPVSIDPTISALNLLNVIPTVSLIDSADDQLVATDLSKQARKQKRKEKQKNKHNASTDSEHSPLKEHKRKLKKKLHRDHHYRYHYSDDNQNPTDLSLTATTNTNNAKAAATNGSGSGAGDTGDDNRPKIKIKFKKLPFPGEETPEAKFFYVPADTVRSAEEEGSRSTSEDTNINTIVNTNISPQNTPTNLNDTIGIVTLSAASPTKKSTKRKGTPRKAITPQNSTAPTQVTTPITTVVSTAAPAENSRRRASHPPKTLTCCICAETGLGTNAATCDECHKSYHFTCLEPPLKKTPKMRGYSWHCAECDPTDEEKK